MATQAEENPLVDYSLLAPPKDVPDEQPPMVSASQELIEARKAIPAKGTGYDARGLTAELPVSFRTTPITSDLSGVATDVMAAYAAKKRQLESARLAHEATQAAYQQQIALQQAKDAEESQRQFELKKMELQGQQKQRAFESREGAKNRGNAREVAGIRASAKNNPSAMDLIKAGNTAAADFDTQLTKSLGTVKKQYQMTDENGNGMLDAYGKPIFGQVETGQQVTLSQQAKTLAATLRGLVKQAASGSIPLPIAQQQAEQAIAKAKQGMTLPQATGTGIYFGATKSVPTPSDVDQVADVGRAQLGINAEGTDGSNGFDASQMSDEQIKAALGIK